MKEHVGKDAQTYATFFHGKYVLKISTSCKKSPLQQNCCMQAWKNSFSSDKKLLNKQFYTESIAHELSFYYSRMSTSREGSEVCWVCLEKKIRNILIDFLTL